MVSLIDASCHFRPSVSGTWTEGPMRMIWKKVLSKRHWLFTVVALMTVGSIIAHSFGEEVSKVKYGFSILGGAGDAWRSTPDMRVYGFLPRVDLPLHRNWDLEFEGNFSYWDIRKEHDLYFLGVNANILFKPIQGSWGSLFFARRRGARL